MKLSIDNFRSIKNQIVEISPITVLYGPNGAGKSSLLYSLQTLKNVLLYSNEPTRFFNYNFLSLGGFEEVVFDHKKNEAMSIGISLEILNAMVSYSVILKTNEGRFILSIVDENKPEVKLELAVSFPYQGNQKIEQIVNSYSTPFTLVWDGFTCQLKADPSAPQDLKDVERFLQIANSAAEQIRKTNIVPIKRGFSKPNFQQTTVTPALITEDEVASYLASEPHKVSRISFYLEQILGRDFRLNTKIGTAIFALDVLDNNTGISCGLVNEGFGVNQIIYFLAKCLNDDSKLICIEEPEVHLHPSAVKKLAESLVKMFHEEDKHFIISTHSETFVLTLLSLVAKKELKLSDISCYLVSKQKRNTVFEEQIINEKGQIQGGLTSFLEDELSDVLKFLAVPDSK